MGLGRRVERRKFADGTIDDFDDRRRPLVLGLGDPGGDPTSLEVPQLRIRQRLKTQPLGVPLKRLELIIIENRPALPVAHKTRKTTVD